MKDGLRFVDCDMHVQEPADLFDRYLDPAFQHRVSTLRGPGGSARRNWLIDGQPISADRTLGQYRKPIRSRAAMESGAAGARNRLSDSARMSFAVERDYDAEAQVMAMELEGVDIAVLFPTSGLYFTAREDLDARFSLAICQAYNNWIHDFCEYSPDQLKWAAMLPLHDVNLACQELVRCVEQLGAVGSFIRPNPITGRYWHSNYWEPLYRLHEELDVAWGFHEGPGAFYSQIEPRFGENRFYRHIASPWVEMQLALIAQLVGGVFEFHPQLRVGYLEAQNSWVPGLLTRIEWDYPNYHETHAPYLSMTPLEYFQRNCWAAVEGSEPEIESTVQHIGAEHMCLSTDYPHFDSNFPHVADKLLEAVPRATAARILAGGAGLWGFTEADFQKADAAAARRREAPPSSAEPAAATANGRQHGNWYQQLLHRQ